MLGPLPTGVFARSCVVPYVDPEVNLLKEPRTIWPAPWIKALEVPLSERRRRGR